MFGGRSLVLLDTLDTPQVLDTATTNIPASSGSVLQIVASLYRTCYMIYVHETCGYLINLYIGASGSEVLHTVIGLGADFFEVSIHKGARVSIRAAENTAISDGILHISFYGLSTDT